MSWATLASNQIVSDTNLADAVATGVFIGRTSIPLTGRELTSTTATSYALVNVSAGRASNQLVTKASLSSSTIGPGPYNLYMYATDGYYGYLSTNGGFSFSQLTGLGYSASAFYNSIAADYYNTYLIMASSFLQNFELSSNGGASSTTKTISNVGSGYTFTSFYPLEVVMSNSGKYMAIVGKETSGTTAGRITVAISNNYGASFTANYTSFYSGNGQYGYIGMSFDGKNITYVGNNLSSYQSWRYTSNDYGVTFSSGGLSSGTFWNVAVAGNIIVILDGGTPAGGSGNIFVSSNGGSSFTGKLTTGGPFNSTTKCSISDDGYYIRTLGEYSGTDYTYFYSTDYGSTFNENNVGFQGIQGMAVGTSYLTFSPLNYYYVDFQLGIANYSLSSTASTTIYSQPISTYNFKNVYKKAINY